MTTSACTVQLPIPMVFISYCSKDKYIANQLIDLLQKENMFVWIDYDQIDYGDSIPEKIENGLDHTDALLFIVTENSTESNWCRVEYETLLMKEINSKKTLVIPVVVGNREPPSLLKRKKYLNVSLNQSQEIIIDDNEFRKLCKSIKKTTAQERLVSLTHNKELRYHSSLLAMVISSALNDFPVNKLYAEQIVHGKRMGELFAVVEKFIDYFDEIITEIIQTVGKQSIGKFDKSNRKLLSIYQDMKNIAVSLEHIAENSPFTSRFKEIAEICVKIECFEGIHLVTILKLKDKGDPLKVIDVMPREDLIQGGGCFETWPHAEVNELNILLDELSNYKHKLKYAIAKSISEN